MISRYTRPAMGRIWSDQNRFEQWLEVELAASEALAEMGVVPVVVNTKPSGSGRGGLSAITLAAENDSGIA